MKKKYESPRAVADLFYPEESISSCYNIACEYGIMGGEKGIHAPNAFTLDGVTIPGDLGADDTHGKLSAGSGCGWAENQIAEVDSNGKVTALKEVNVMNHKILDCDVIKQDGDTVYWTTQSGKIDYGHIWGKSGLKAAAILTCYKEGVFIEVKKDIMEFVGPAYHWICWYFSVSEYQPISKV